MTWLYHHPRSVATISSTARGYAGFHQIEKPAINGEGLGDKGRLERYKGNYLFLDALCPAELI